MSTAAMPQWKPVLPEHEPQPADRISLQLGSTGPGDLFVSVWRAESGRMFGHGLFTACEHFDCDADAAKALTLKHVRDAMQRMVAELDAMLPEAVQ